MSTTISTRDNELLSKIATILNDAPKGFPFTNITRIFEWIQTHPKDNAEFVNAVVKAIEDGWDFEALTTLRTLAAELHVEPFDPFELFAVRKIDLLGTPQQRFNATLKAIRKRGIAFRLNVKKCCRGCIGWEDDLKLESEDWPHAYLYGSQGSGTKWLSDGDPVDVTTHYINHSSVEVANVVAEEFRAHGFEIDWDGTEYRCVGVIVRREVQEGKNRSLIAKVNALVTANASAELFTAIDAALDAVKDERTIYWVDTELRREISRSGNTVLRELVKGVRYFGAGDGVFTQALRDAHKQYLMTAHSIDGDLIDAALDGAA